MATWPANGETDWNTKMLAFLAIEHNTDGTHSAAGLTAQVVNTQTGAYIDCSTILPSDDSIPQNTEGNEVMTLAITPTNINNKLKIEIVVQCGIQTDNGEAGIALFQDSIANALAVGMGGITAHRQRTSLTLTHYMTAGTTGVTTFKVRLGPSSGRIGFNGKETRIFGGRLSSSITITEIIV